VTKEEIFRRVKDVLVESLCCDDDQISLAARLKSDLGCERIDFLDIAFRLSKDFGIHFDPAKLFDRKKVKTVQVSDVIEFIEKALLVKV
jgi:acyl carrier protein